MPTSQVNFYPDPRDRLAPRDPENTLLLEDEERAEAGLQRYPAPARRIDRSLASLDSIAHALTATTEGVDVLLQTIARTVAEVFDSPFVFVVVDSGYRQRRVVYQAGRDQEETLRIDPLEHIPCLNEQTLSTPGLIRVDRLPPDHRACRYLGNMISVPMLSEGKPEGYICMQTGIASELDGQEAATLQIVANQAAVAVQNARRFEDSLHLRAQTEELYRIAVQQKNEAERKQRELLVAQDEIDSMEREQIVGAEREHIARELHDDVAQILISIGLNLEWCRQHLPVDSQIQERIGLLKQLTRNGLYEIRNVILGLSSVNISEVGLNSALDKLVQDWQQLARIPATFELEGELRALPDGVGNALYYIAQEALYNVFKHAQARQVQVRLTVESEAFTLTVTDDGIGIGKRDDGQRHAPVTFGIKNMHRRAEELGGSLLIGEGEGKGTRITARIPG